MLTALVDAPWYVPNRVLHKDLGIQTVREEVMLYSKKIPGSPTGSPECPSDASLC
jgi:hypothetical protein